MTRDHLRNEWVAEALDAADDEELWRQQRAVDLDLARQVETWDDRREAFVADRDELRGVAERAVLREWERERHADDMDDGEWRRTVA